MASKMSFRICIGWALLAASLAGAQPADLSERGVVDTWFRERRTGKTAPPRQESVLGITLWELRPATDRDDPAMVLKYSEPGGKTTAWVARRADTAQALARGARVRIAIESAHEGYLYVVNREEYAGGRLGTPYLIFPTTRIRNGDNAVRPGRLIEIPAREDRPPFFVLKSADDESAYTGELLTVLISPRPLQELTIGRVPLELSDQQVRQWEKQWRTATRRYTLNGGAGKPPTRAEREAASLVERRLTHEDPVPQDYYVVSVKPGSPFLVEIPVRLAR